LESSKSNFKSSFYKLGWTLWIFQNMLLIVPFIAFFIDYFSSIFESRLEFIIDTGLNILFTFTLLIDIVSVFLISLGLTIYFWNLQKENKSTREQFLMPLSGYLWIVLTVLWRAPFFFLWGFELGFAQVKYVEFLVEDYAIYNHFFNNPFLYIILIIGASCLFVFLYLHEKHAQLLINVEFINERYIGRGTIFGALNILGIVLLFFGSNIMPQRSLEDLETLGRGTSGIFLLSGMFVKIFFTPLLGILTAIKFRSYQEIPNITVQKDPQSAYFESLQ